MKKFITTIALAAAVSVPSFAQQEIVKPMNNRANAVEETEGYERMLKAKYNIELRKVAGEALELTEEQMSDFTPILMDYLRAKEDLMERRNKLVSKYKSEMKEDDTIKDEMNETGDFIENYWEADIAEMELKKDYFDRFEDAITPTKAIRFFTIEQMFQDRIQRTMLIERLPEMIFLEPVTYSYDVDIKDFAKWKKVNIDGKVGLDHEFTYTGLEKLLKAAESMVVAEGIFVPDFTAKKTAIMEKATMLKTDWKSTKHADHARDAFQHTAKVLAEIASNERFDVSDAWVTNLEAKANMIEDKTLLTDQASTVYSFFDTAEAIVNELVAQANDGSRK